MRDFLLVCAGGAAGSGARYLVSIAALRWLSPTFPFSTLAVNVAGSFAMGAILEAAARGAAIPDALRLALTTGILGGFTTYSTFNHETLALARAGSFGVAAANLALTVLGCLVAGLAGLALGRFLVEG